MKKEDEYISNLMSEETDFWFDGQIDWLIAAVANKRQVSKEEIQRSRDLLEILDKN